MTIKVAIVFGTRPEAIKLAPVILGMKTRPEWFEPYVLVTGQHDELLSQVLQHFQIKPDRNLGIMTADQTLFDVTTRALHGIGAALKEVRPDVVMVQGDTTTTFAAALAAYYEQIPLAHVEAGLRTHQKYNPFPEELNRRLVSALADLHFAPTPRAGRQLRQEGIAKQQIFITGNTAIDALLMSVRKNYTFHDHALDAIDFRNKRVIVLTMHRRESFGAPMRNILSAVSRIADDFPEEVDVLFPVHFNPEVRRAVRDVLGDAPRRNLHLVDPLGYEAFVQVMDRAFLILTDSGGIQEEAPALGKPVLVLRETTERPEGVAAGTAKLVGTNPDAIYKAVRKLLTSRSAYNAMAKAISPYGDGKAAARILRILRQRVRTAAKRPTSHHSQEPERS